MNLANGWTGGQYSLFRAILGAYLFVHFARLAPWAAELFSSEGMLSDGSASPFLRLFPNVLAIVDRPEFVTMLLVVAAGLSVLFAIGWRDRLSAVMLWYLWACLFGRNPLIGNSGLPYVGWILLAHVFLPPAPYGSWDARGQVDPRGNWHMPGNIFLVAWILLALSYSYSGFTKLASPSWADGTALARVLESPLARPTYLREWLLAMPSTVLQLATWSALALELLFAPLALFRLARPIVWSATLLLRCLFLVLLDCTDLGPGMVLMHIFTFDPAWVPALQGPTEMVYYDGHCGLCHRAVRFVLAEDRSGTAFHFATLDSTAIKSTVPEAERLKLPDSSVVQTADGRLLVKSAGLIHILRRLGGAWRVLGELARPMPAGMLDWLYDRVASIRKQLFAAPSAACPLLPPELRQRFLG